MHTVDVLEVALGLVRQAGYRIRQEWLGGGGGACEIKGVKWVFLDLALGPDEQLDMVLDVLRRDPRLAEFEIPAPLQTLLGPNASPPGPRKVA